MHPVTDEIDQPARLDVRTETGPTTVLALNGELDPATAPTLQGAIDAALEDPAVKRLVLDLGDLGFIDSSGLRVFVVARDSMRERSGDLVLRSPSANTERLLSITGLTEVVEVE
jgi:anti-anti-sigma factor